jgi:hypothetical protein
MTTNPAPIGKAGEVLVAGELVLRGVEIAYPASDVGIDLLAYRLVPKRTEAASDRIQNIAKVEIRWTGRTAGRGKRPTRYIKKASGGVEIKRRENDGKREQPKNSTPIPKPKAALPSRLSVEAASGSPLTLPPDSTPPDKAAHQIEQRPAQVTKSVVTKPMTFK